MEAHVPIMNVTEENRLLEAEIRQAIARVIAHGQYMLGPEVETFERQVAEMLGARHVIGVNSGTDALLLSYKALGVMPGDEIITVANSFVATAGAIRQAGAVPHFVDVGPDENLDPDRLEAAIGPRTAAIVPVHLRGKPAAMDRILAFARDRGIPVVEDACQAFGARRGGKAAGTFGRFGCFSMHPQKVLGAIGDAGMIVTDDDDAAARLRLLRHHGLRNRDDVDVWGQNSRLDTIQAAVLLVKLRRVGGWIEKRRAIARRYLDAFAGFGLGLPAEGAEEYAVYYHFSVFSPRRDALRDHLARRGIDARIHYPTPIHAQAGAAPGTFIVPPEGLPGLERQSLQQLSLPVHHDLTDGQVQAVIDAVAEFHARPGVRA